MALLYLLKLLLILAVGRTGGQPLSMTKLIRQRLSEQEYCKQDRPPPVDKPTLVHVGFYIETLSSISEIDTEFTISIYLRQKWKDERLSHNSTEDTIMLDSSFVEDVWIPSLFFVNGKSERRHTIPALNVLLTLGRDGTVFFSQKLSVKLYCGMNLVYFPFDRQECPVKMMSYAYNTDRLDMKWLNGNESVEITPNLDLPEFVIESTDILDCSAKYISGFFSCLEARITLVRRYMHYAIKIYVPSTLIVILSWANFWIDHRSTPARVSLALLCILTITTQNAGVGSGLPKVSYLKSIDVWMSVCLVFVFTVFIEFTLVNIMARRMETKKQQAQLKEGQKQHAQLKEGSLVQQTQLKEGVKALATIATNSVGIESGGKQRSRCDTASQMMAFKASEFIHRRHTYLNETIIEPLTLDTKSRVAFPLLFIIFNIVYWLVYLL